MRRSCPENWCLEVAELELGSSARVAPCFQASADAVSLIGGFSLIPANDSKLKHELAYVIGSINDNHIAFFRGQVLVAICDVVLYGIGFAIIGLPYAIVIGAMAMVLTIIQFLGAIVTCASALLIALVTFGDWQHPLGVLIVFAVVQGIEGYVLQPKILGDRVGLHPMIIILAIMTGTTLLGGILGGLLAIPLAAALRVILLRYVWKKRKA